uniref:Olfactory receptor n=1 Tax=Anolis carolinensis TaxID=28377 RepID=A0A803SNL6_ANOCA
MKMEVGNGTMITEFILLGFGDLKEFQILLFVLFLTIYIMTVAGNLLIVVLVMTDHHLHTPMYFFLGNLSSLEICYSSTIVPRMLVRFVTHNQQRSISVKACFVQFHIISCLVGTECYLLAMMSYDRYLAICKPLHYWTLMNARLSFQLAALSWISGILFSTSLIVKLSQMSFCGPNKIDHFFCDIVPDISDISCSDTHFVELQSFIYASVFTFPPFALTLSSYVFIIVTIIRIPSTSGRQKAFSTCSSHLIVVALYYGTLMVIYLLPHSRYWRHLRKEFSLPHTVLTPLLNPLIYSLRNKEVKEAMNRIFGKLSYFRKSAFKR